MVEETKQEGSRKYKGRSPYKLQLTEADHILFHPIESLDKIPPHNKLHPSQQTEKE